MNINSKKRGGFGLVEVVISMALIAIISVGVYNGYILMIRQIKDAEEKQEAAMAGKRTIEQIQGTEEFQLDDSNLKLGAINIDLKKQVLEKEGTQEIQYIATRDLNNKYEIWSGKQGETKEYIEEIILKHTKTGKGENISIDKGIKTIAPQDYKLYLSSDNDKYYIRDTEDKSTIQEEIICESNKSIIYIYLENSSNGLKKVSVKNAKGIELLSRDIDSINLFISCSEYQNVETGQLKNLEINIVNKISENNVTDAVPNIYIEKSYDLNVDVNVNKGEANIYNNINIDETDEIGDLYDVEVHIKKNNKKLFDGYDKKNIIIK